MNPFLLKGYLPKYFCDRREETTKLINAADNQQDVTLYAYRRLGKSALIHHVFYHLRKSYTCIYVDIWGTTSIAEFTREMANAVVRSAIFSKRSTSKKLMDFIKALGASFSIGMDGLPSIDIIYNEKNQPFSSIEEIFKLLNQLPDPIIIAIDEFQEIKKYPHNAPFEAKLRVFVQQSQRIRFIFSGSEHHLLNDIFNSYNKPFYQSTRTLSLGKIQKDTYMKFILNHFSSRRKKIEPTIIEHILNITYGHTYYVQALCNYLFSQSGLPKNIAAFEKMYRDFLMEKSVFYSELPERLTLPQFSCVKAFARKGLISSPTSGEFINASKVKSASSMQRIIHSLLDKQLIIKDEGGYRLYDVFLEHYLKYAV
jgi:AAA+ ATPase superfamily predicted ATPase